MTRAELIELIRNNENSGVAFNRDDVSAAKLASEMVALLNLRGGHILLGVEVDGTVSGLTRDPRTAEEWVMEGRPRPHSACNHTVLGDYSMGFRQDCGHRVAFREWVPPRCDRTSPTSRVKKGSAWITKVRVAYHHEARCDP